jgi:hypothetical protein
MSHYSDLEDPYDSPENEDPEETPEDQEQPYETSGVGYSATDDYYQSGENPYDMAGYDQYAGGGSEYAVDENQYTAEGGMSQAADVDGNEYGNVQARGIFPAAIGRTGHTTTPGGTGAALRQYT